MDVCKDGESARRTLFVRIVALMVSGCDNAVEELE
jgi:hypothetical protein